MFRHDINNELHLRTFTMDDAPEFFNLIIQNKSYLKQWLGWLDAVQQVEDTKGTIKARLQEVVDTGGYPKNFAIIYDGKIAGTIGFNSISNAHRIGEIGYWLGERFQGNGIMTQSLKAIIYYGFQTLHLNRIQISAAEYNIKSRALPERLGFIEEGHLRDAEWLYDHYVDHIIYGLLAKDWEKHSI